MLRTIAGVVIGYLVSVAWVVITLTLAWMALGAAFAFQGDTPHASTGWSLLMLFLGLFGAILAGWVAAAIGRGQRAATVLAVVMLVLGLAFAAYNLTLDREAMANTVLAGRAPSEISMKEAASASVAPTWYDFGIALVGAAGAFYGGRLRTRRTA